MAGTWRLTFITAFVYLLWNLSISYQVGAVPLRLPSVDNEISDEDCDLSIDDFIAGSRLTADYMKTIEMRNESDARKWRAKMTAGDIAGYPRTIIKQLDSVSEKPKGAARSAVRDTGYRWPNGEVPYTLSKKYGPLSRGMIANAMDTFQRKTCIRFVKRDPHRHKDYVKILPDDGCYSMMGRVGGSQPLSLDDGCLEPGIIMHELMHAVGFIHEHSRSDRDQYVRINWKNIIPGFEEEFDRFDDIWTDNMNLPYDYGSIMHYDTLAFTRNNKPTIQPLQKVRSSVMGQRDGFSQLDIQKINKLYKDVCRSVESESPAIVMFDCADKNGHCAEWAKHGYCTYLLHEEYMRVTCPLSCQLC